MKIAPCGKVKLREGRGRELDGRCRTGNVTSFASRLPRGATPGSRLVVLFNSYVVPFLEVLFHAGAARFVF